MLGEPEHRRRLSIHGCLLSERVSRAHQNADQLASQCGMLGAREAQLSNVAIRGRSMKIMECKCRSVADLMSGATVRLAARRDVNGEFDSAVIVSRILLERRLGRRRMWRPARVG
jgi:hypothetical protein